MELDRTDDPGEYRFAYEPGGGRGPAVVRIVSYSGGVYMVQPVDRSGGARQDSGSQRTGSGKRRCRFRPQAIPVCRADAL